MRPVGDATPSRISPWIWRVLRRGLARDPNDRFPSMHALVDALADDPAIRRRKIAWLGGGALAAVATGAALVQLVPRGTQACPVDVPHANIAAIATVSDADIAAHVGAAIDDYAGRWTTARQQACTAHDEVAASCLDRGRRELRELVKILETADAATVARAQEAISRLRDPAGCTTAAAVLPSSVADTAIGEQARVVLDRATTLQYVGKSDEAARLVGPLVKQLTTQPRLLAEALLIQARIDNEHARPEQAEARLYDALHAAERGRDDMTVAAIWVEIVMATGAQSHRFDLAMANARAAEATIARVVAGTDLEVRYDYTLGTMLLGHGKLDDARKRLEEGILECGDEPRRQGQVGLFEMALCDVERQANKTAAAKHHCERGITLLEKSLGRDHLRVGVSLSIVGALAFGQHDMAAAQAAYERAISIFEKQKASDHVANALVRANLGSVYASNGDVKGAREQFERSLALFEQYHPDHPQKQFALQGLAGIALRMGDYDNAVIYYRRVRDAMAKTYAPEHQSLLIADFNLALALAKHHPDEAQTLVEDVAARALTPGKESWMIASRAFDEAATLAEDRKDRAGSISLREKALAALDHSDVPAERAIILREIAQTHAGMKRFDRALPVAEQAVALITKAPDDPYEVGMARFQLTVALDGTHREPARALAVAKQAADDFAKAQAGDQLDFYRNAAARFIKDHAR
jgi:tetratricopeptide (TPR) repeat protein